MKKMRKLLSITLIAVMIMSMAACGNSQKGKEKTEADLGIGYDDIYFLSDHEICVQNSNQCEIYTMHGIRKFKSDFDNNLYYVTSGSGFRNYQFLMEGVTEQVRLKFFSSAR